MKHTLLVLILLIIGGVGYAWWSVTPHIDTTGKVHVTLYEGASGTWDPQMQVLPFDRAPSTQLTLRWQAPEKTYNHFVVTISNAQGEFMRSESGEHDRLSLDPDGFEPGAEYIFALQACLDRSCEQWLIANEEYHGKTAETSDTEPRFF